MPRTKTDNATHTQEKPTYTKHNVKIAKEIGKRVIALEPLESFIAEYNLHPRTVNKYRDGTKAYLLAVHKNRPFKEHEIETLMPNMVKRVCPHCIHESK